MQLRVILALTMILPLLSHARTWTNKDGKTLDAEFVRIDGNKVVLKRGRDGKVLKISKSRFSKKDQQYLKKLADKQPKKPRASVSSTKLGVFAGGLFIILLPIFILVGKGIFGDMHGFLESLRFWLQPDLISWWRGEALEDWFGELKLGFFVLVCVAIYGASFFLIASKLLDWF